MGICASEFSHGGMMTNGFRTLLSCALKTGALPDFRRQLNRLVPIAAFLWLAICSPNAAADAASGQKVLILHSYHQGYLWTDMIQEGFSRALSGPYPKAELYVEYMNTKRQTADTMFPHLATLYKQLYQNVKFDVIVASDNNALDFLLLHRDRLFPGVPVVFCGINDFFKYRLDAGSGYTGVREDLDIFSTISVALKLHPGTRKIALITDATETGRINLGLARKVAEKFSAIEFVELNNLTAPRLTTRLKELKDDTIVLALSFFRDQAGRTFTARESMEFIVGASNRPVYTVWDFYMAPGAVGGKLLSGRLQGENASALVGKILRGESAGSLAVIESPTEYTFDYSGLRKFGIDESQLPVGSVVSGRPDTFYTRYKYYLWFGAVLFSVQVVIIIVLLSNIARRRQEEIARKNAVDALQKTNEMFSLFMLHSPVHVFIKEVAGSESRVLMSSENFREIVGMTASEMTGKTMTELFPPGVAEAMIAADRTVLSMSESLKNNVTINGRTYASISFPLVRSGKAVVASYHMDVTERQQAEEALRIAATAFESQEGMFITDAARVIIRVNQAFSEITGYSAEEAVGQTPNLLNSGHHDAAFFASMTDSIQRTGMWQGEVWNRRKCGEVYPEWLTITAVKDDAGTLSNYVATLTDITSRKEAEEEIHNLAFYDPLTRLPNRRLLLDRLHQALASSARNEMYGALLFIDLDNFKNLNDTLGHDIGDLLLQQVGQRLTACVREGDTVARLGGDEFVVMLEDLSKNMQESATQCETIGEKILAGLNQSYQLASHSHYSTPSIGITLFFGHRESIEELLKRADLAMYQAKAAGRNTLRFFDPAMQAAVATRAELEADLREAVQKNQFFLHYQPQVVGAGRLTGAEVLVRWQHPDRGVVPPTDFISLAEETGLILPLGHWVLETACAQLAVWADQPEMAHLTVAVNVSANQFHQSDFVSQVLAVLEQTGANPQRLKLELTESLLVDDLEDIIAKMMSLKAKGVGFSLDDFGTGYSSLSYLKRLPLDQLKIDQGFVRDILIDPNDAAIAKMVIALGESLGLAVIAEGVEIEAQRDFLARQGCHAYQGYLFSRPLPVGEFEVFAKRR